MEETDKKAPPSKVCFCRKTPVISGLVVLALLAGASGLAFTYAGFSPFSVLFADKMTDFDALERRVGALENKISAFREEAPAPTANAPSITPEAPLIEEKIRDLEDRIKNEEKEDARILQKAVATTLIFWELREEARNGFVFTERLATLRALMAENPKIVDLAEMMEPFAKDPPLTLLQLTEAFRIEEQNAQRAPEDGEKTSLVDRIKNMLRPLISVTRTNTERFASIKKALNAADAPAALNATNALPEELAKGLNLWKEKLEARVTLDAAVEKMTKLLMTPPIEKNAP